MRMSDLFPKNKFSYTQRRREGGSKGSDEPPFQTRF